MWLYLLKRFLAFIPAVFIVATLIFFLTRVVPGDPAWVLVGHQLSSEERVAEVRQELGLDKPILTQYVMWLSMAVRGDFGTSIFFPAAGCPGYRGKIPSDFEPDRPLPAGDHSSGYSFGHSVGSPTQYPNRSFQHLFFGVGDIIALVLGGFPAGIVVFRYLGMVPHLRVSAPFSRIYPLDQAPYPAGRFAESGRNGVADPDDQILHVGCFRQRLYYNGPG